MTTNLHDQDQGPGVAATLRALPQFEPLGMRVVVVIMQKGGVGKTATAVGLASQLAADGVPVVAVDLCHTGALSQSFGLTRVEDERNLATLMLGTWDGSIYDLAVPVADRLWVVPMSMDGVTLGDELISRTYREQRLRTALEDLPTRAVVIVDCPPTLDTRTNNALVAAGATPDMPQFGGTLLCPELVTASLETLDLLLDQVNALNHFSGGAGIRHLGWFASTTDQTVASRKARGVLEKLPLTKLGEMPRRTRIKDARDAGQPILTFDPRSDVNQIHRELMLSVRGLIHV